MVRVARSLSLAPLVCVFCVCCFLGQTHFAPLSGTLGLDRTTRPAGGGRVPGIGGFRDGGDEDEEREGRQSQKAELEEKLKDLSQRPDIYEYLASSFAPSIWEMEDVKKGILLQLFGGTNKTWRKEEAEEVRGTEVISTWVILVLVNPRFSR